jgi:Spy/CpxP family protein refolding chaperone
MKTNILRAGALALAVTAAGAFAQGPGYGPGSGYGPGMGGGFGPGMGGGYGSGMMGGGYGPGRGGYGGGLAALNLTDEQRDKILALQEENRSKNWGTMGQMRSEMFKLRGMYNSDKLDSKAYSEQQKKVDDLRRQMIASRIEARDQIEKILTPEQRKQFRSFGPWWATEEGQ